MANDLEAANVTPDLAQAANDIRFLATRFKGLIAAGDALENLGSIKNAVDETQRRLEELRTQEDAAKTRLADLAGTIEAKTAEHVDLSAKHESLKTEYGRVAGMIDALRARVVG
jgi:chromosome segregation ATPase